MRRKWLSVTFVLFCFPALNMTVLIAEEQVAPKCDEQSFTPLFDGRSLAGWTGATDGYEVVDGVIACIPEKGGNLFTEREYADFVLCFEFKLPPGGNNGLGIRAPLQGRTSREGMEIQILDDTDPRYADIKPWQYHGSIYGVVPAQPGHLRPVGQWNQQQIVCNGTRITVTLNGVTIVDADLSQHTGKPTLDGRDHPGIERRSGHIGLLGHGHRVEYRNVRIRELN